MMNNRIGRKVIAGFLGIFICSTFTSLPVQALGEDIYPDRLGSYSTTSTNTKEGTWNMIQSLSKVNGTRLEPNEVFSFNTKIGRADSAHGYKQADAILNGCMNPVYGGGICQASTTVYGAALRSGMEITCRKNHSIASNYCPLGQDAMVNWPAQDFCFQNTTGTPVYIEAGVKDSILTVTIYGHKSTQYDAVEIKSQRVGTVKAPQGVCYIMDDTLNPGVKKWVSSARDGIKTTAQRIFYKGKKIVKTEELSSSYYPPQKAIYLLGPEKPEQQVTPK